MKKITLFAAFLAVMFTLGLTSCTKGEPTIVVGDPSSMSFVGSSLDIFSSVPSPSTKTTDALAQGTKIGIHILNTKKSNSAGVDEPTGDALATNTNSAKFGNILHTVDASGNIIKDVDGSIILTTGFTYDVYAYSPYSESVTGAGVSTIVAGHDVDILWAKTENQKPSTSTITTQLIFDHKATQISFSIKSNDPENEIDFSTGNIKLTVTGFRGAGTMDLSTGALTVPEDIATESNISETISAASDKIVGDTHFLPVADAMTLNVTVELLGGVNADTYEGEIKQTFKSGESWHYDILVEERRVTLDFKGTVNKWTPQTGDINVGN